MSVPLPHLFLVRFSGDLSTKARGTRARFLRRLRHNLRDALDSEGIPAELELDRNRGRVRTADAAAGAVLARVFGVQSVSRAEARPAAHLDAVVAAGRELFAGAVRGRRFAVRARRVGERSRVRLEPRALERELGAALLPDAAGVDLTRPEVTARIELLGEEAFLFTEVLPGPGGLPLGVEGRALALVSGGFDSAVAAWMLHRRGVDLGYVFCNLGGATHQLGTLRVMKQLADRWCYGTRPRLHAVDFEPVVVQLQARTEMRLWQVVLKRLMLRAAERIARETRALALVTGEAVGQVSSQTLANLATISRATQLPILRPLVGHNKDEIIARAEQIGTAELSAVVGEYCAMVPRRPATGASAAQVEAEEALLDPDLLDRVVAERAVFDLRGLDLESLALPELEVEDVAEDATAIDLRSRVAFDAWHWPGALHLDFARALAAYAKFDRRQRYVLYCEFGLKSAHLAELMRREGLDAHHFKGGLKALLLLARKRGVGPDAGV